ncbi:hypothetical protein NE237_032200 [Protea cynaroides]|uniref:Stigma-specific Stig1 family protein n=1 Tax=Protea cynaroides TaxID=273540 RepID=A0A9Q0L2N1_9MAGN|nr:hypothetical protein NE237_032200 [Protea cynaroides]
MRTMKIFFCITIVMALAAFILIAANNRKEEEPAPVKSDDHHSSPANQQFIPLKRVSRFLAEQKNPRAADHCNKDNDVCYDEEGQQSTCCNNKCVNLTSDSRYCGACKNKCHYTHTCCNGECVDLSFDKRHCGICFNKCITRDFCLYGMCDYA